MTTAEIGAIAGSGLGVLGALVGTWCSVRGSRPEARGFAVRASVAWWVGTLAFVGAMLALPDPERHFLWIPYAVLLPLAILATRRGYARAAGPAARSAAE